MVTSALPASRVEVPLLVAFIDLSGFALQATRVADDELAAIVDGYYELVAARVTAAGGRVVKFIGDGTLVVFSLHPSPSATPSAPRPGRASRGGARDPLGDSPKGFDIAAADAGITALLELKDEIDRYLENAGWGCRANIKAHVGPVIAGPYGARDDKRFDVIGKTVNTAAMIDSTGVALSAEAFRKLSPAMRQRFKKHTWPTTYIRVEDPHRFRRR